MSLINLKYFKDINLNDAFFDSLKADYTEFSQWFTRKAEEDAKAYVMEEEGIQGFLYLKKEETSITDVEPHLSAKPRLKIGTFKINPHGTRLGERFIKKIFDLCINYNLDEVYVTIFPTHTALYNLFTKYGFIHVGIKRTVNGEEHVLLKNFPIDHRDILLNYPRFKKSENRKYGLGIYPQWHSKLFPDSLLNNERYDIIRDVSHTNSIHKVYISFMTGIGEMTEGDLVLIYRTTDHLGPAHYRSVVTSVCTIEEVLTRDSFNSKEDYLNYCEAYSVFNRGDLSRWYDRQGHLWIIKMLYNAAFSRKVTKQRLMDEAGIDPPYWGFFNINNDEFVRIINLGEINENYIIN